MVGTHLQPSISPELLTVHRDMFLPIFGSIVTTTLTPPPPPSLLCSESACLGRPPDLPFSYSEPTSPPNWPLAQSCDVHAIFWDEMSSSNTSKLLPHFSEYEYCHHDQSAANHSWLSPIWPSRPSSSSHVRTQSTREASAMLPWNCHSSLAHRLRGKTRLPFHFISLLLCVTVLYRTTDLFVHSSSVAPLEHTVE
jgi:hypothetical protein